MIDVVALGELLVDFTWISADEEGYPTLAAHPGGAPANFLATLSKLGARTALIGKVGGDVFGAMLVNTLKEAHIETKGMRIDDSVFTTLAFVTLDEKGERAFSFARKPGADTQLDFSEVDTKLIDAAKVFHFGTLSLIQEPVRTATKQAVAYAKAQEKWITFDPNLRKPLWSDMEECRAQMLWGLQQADIVKISDEEVDFLFGLHVREGAEYIRTIFNVSLVFVTCGSEGAWFDNGRAAGQVPCPRGLQIVDTTGAGDIFGGSAIYKWLKTGKAPSALTRTELTSITAFSCACASLSTTRPGGISSVPDKDAVEQLLARQRKNGSC